MATLSVREADDAVSGMHALRSTLTNDLKDILQRIDELENSCAHDAEVVKQELIVYRKRPVMDVVTVEPRCDF